MGALRPVQKERTEACPEWAHRGLPRVGAQRSARMGAQRPALNERTGGLPGLGAQGPA